MAVREESVELLPAMSWTDNKGSPRVKIAVREPSLIEAIEVVWESGQPATAVALELLGALVDLARDTRG